MSRETLKESEGEPNGVVLANQCTDRIMQQRMSWLAMPNRIYLRLLFATLGHDV